MIAEATGNVWSPWYLDNTKSNNNKAVSDLSKLYIIGISIVFIAVMLSSPYILLLMAPKDYSTGLGSLIIITSSVFFQFLYRFPLGYEQYSRNMKWVAVSTMISAAVNLGLNFIFVPTWGLVGAASSTFISYVLLFLLHDFVARFIIKGYNIKFLNYLPGILVVLTTAVISYFFIDYWYYRYTLLISILIVVFVYIKANKNNNIFKVLKSS